ncbi:MAG: aminopeptidase P family protein [Acholeplasmataceae bacterium]
MTNKRIETYLESVSEKSISIFYSGGLAKKSNDQSYPFHVNRSFYYFSQINQADSILVIIKGETLTKSYVFIEKRSAERILWDGDTLSFDHALSLSGVDEIKDRTTFDDFISTILSANRTNVFGELDTLYLDFEAKPMGALSDWVSHYAENVLKQYPFLSIKNNHLLLATLRMKKDEHEFQLIQSAVDISVKAFHHIMKKAKDVNTEYELEAEYNYILNKHRVKPSFDTIVASGGNATVLHYVNNNDHIGDDQLILVDAGVEYEQYCSDITRTFPKSGTFTPRQKEIYELVLKANEETIKWVKPGITLKEFNDFGKKILTEGLKSMGLIKEDDEIIKYYYHSLGHSLGLDVHDIANYAKPIVAGHMLTVEPGLYIKEEGIGIRIEDNILITHDGCINLSKDIIKSVKDIENLMK